MKTECLSVWNENKTFPVVVWTPNAVRVSWRCDIQANFTVEQGWNNVVSSFVNKRRCGQQNLFHAGIVWTLANPWKNHAATRLVMPFSSHTDIVWAGPKWPWQLSIYLPKSKQHIIFPPITDIMSQSIPTGYIPPPPGNPGENFFERATPGHPGKFFCIIPCPGAKNDGQIPGGGAKFSQTRRNCSVLSLQKSLKN